MRYSGPLGFRRFTAVGPLVQADKEMERIAQIVVDTAEELDVDLSDMDEDEEEQLRAEVASNIYGGTTTIQNAKEARLERCLNESWSNAWIDGFQKQIGFEYTDLETVALQTKACVSLVENATSDDSQQLPESLR